MSKSNRNGTKIIRGAAAVMAGYLTFYLAVLMLWLASGYHPRRDIPSTGFLVISTVFELFFAVAAGYLIAFIARHKELLYAGIFAAFFVFTGIFYLCLRLNHYPVWFPISTILINAPGVLLGAILRIKRIYGKNPVHSNNGNY